MLPSNWTVPAYRVVFVYAYIINILDLKCIEMDVVLYLTFTLWLLRLGRIDFFIEVSASV